MAPTAAPRRRHTSAGRNTGWSGRTRDNSCQNPRIGQYSTDANLAARQRLWAQSRHDPPGFEWYPWVLDLAGLLGGGTERVLDIGCGNGVFEAAMVARGHDGMSVALDLSAGMLAEVQGADRVRADAQRLPLRSDTFDVVLAPHMLYHVPNLEAAVAECRRVLRPGGTFVATTNGDRNVAEIQRLIRVATETPERVTGSGGGAFTLESGGERLGHAFGDVTRVDFPVERVVVDDADLVADFVASMADFHPPDPSRPWSAVVDRVRGLAQQVIDADGGFSITWSIGAFLCR